MGTPARIFLLSFLLANAFSVAKAAFPDLGVGVRPMGMGGAYIGVANDANAPLWNPAGMTQLANRELTATYSTLYAGLNAQLFTGETDHLGYHFLSYAQPIRSAGGVLAASWLFFDSAFYDEQTYLLSYAKRITPRISGGIGAKVLRVGIASNAYTQADPDLANVALARTAATVDLSLLYFLSERVQMGVTGENLLPADVGILGTEDVPMQWGIGFAHHSGDMLQVIDFVLRDRRVNDHRDVSVRVGIEGWLLQRQVGLRAGYNVRSITLGASYRYGGKEQAQLDYAFIYPLGSIVDTLGSHRIGLSIRF